MKIKTKHILSLAVVAAVAALPMVTQAQGWIDPKIDCQRSGLPCTPFFDVLYGFMKFLLAILTIVGVMGFIISGLIYITAGGAGKADLARHWLTYSIIGMIVGLSGYIIIITISNILNGNPGM